MKYQITEGKTASGNPIFRIYRIEGEVKILLDGESTLDRARTNVHNRISPSAEVTVEEIES
jgi:hypothetical protein